MLGLLAGGFLIAPCRAADPATDLATRTLAARCPGLRSHGRRGRRRTATSCARPTAAAPGSWPRVPTIATLTGVCFPDEKHGWAVGHDAVILHSEDGGLTWTKQYQGPDLQVSFLDVCFLDAQTGFVAGAYGQFLATGDGGRTWTQRSIITEDYFLNRLSLGPDGTLYLAGEHGTLLRSADRGATWIPIRTLLRRLLLRHPATRPEDGARLRPARAASTGPRTTATPGRPCRRTNGCCSPPRCACAAA